MEAVCPILGRLTQVDETAFSRGPWRIVRCRETGLVFLANPPQYTELAEHFAWEKSFVSERRRRETDEPLWSAASRMTKALRNALLPTPNRLAALAALAAREARAARPERWGQRVAERPLRLLDIGCGGGHLTVQICRSLHARGLSAVPLGIEVSPQLAAAAARQLTPQGGSVVCANAMDGLGRFAEGSVDVAVMASFLEHERDPLGLLRRLRPALSSHAAVVLKVPNLACWNRRIRGKRWCGFRLPDHVNYFTPQTMQILAGEAGYVMRQGPLDRLPLNDNMYAVLTVDLETQPQSQQGVQANRQLAVQPAVQPGGEQPGEQRWLGASAESPRRAA